MDRKALFGLILVVSSLLMMSISITLPWYQVTMETGNEVTHVDAYFDYTETTVDQDGEETTETEYYDDLPAVKKVMDNTYGVFCIALFVLVIGMVSVVLYMLEKISKNAAGLLLVLGTLFLLLVPLYLMFALPPAVGEDLNVEGGPNEEMGEKFFGSNDHTYTTTWGAGSGWFLTLLAAGVTGVSAVLLLSSKPRLREAPIGRAKLRRSTQIDTSKEKPEKPKPNYEGKNTIFEDEDGWIRY